MSIFSENSKRSLSKAVSFRILIIITNLAIVFLITKRVEVTFSIVLVSSITSTLIYYIHERVWDKIRWGKEG